MTQSLAGYVVSFQAERFYKRTRYHWIICRAQNLDELVSWGHAPTRELAETAAQTQIRNLSSGLIQGGPRQPARPSRPITGAELTKP
jgi:hypothetical protein